MTVGPHPTLAKSTSALGAGGCVVKQLNYPMIRRGASLATERRLRLSRRQQRRSMLRNLLVSAVPAMKYRQLKGALWLGIVFFGLVGHAVAAPKLKEGAYRVDWNRKVRNLCVDAYSNDDLSARDWQGVMAAQGVVCTLADVRDGKQRSSWRGVCSQPGMGRVFRIEHRVSVQVNADGSFDILTELSGDQQARIPIHGEPLPGAAAACGPDQAFFRPWQ